MNNTEKVLDYLHSISPKRATNADIVSATLIKPHQQVFQITKRLHKAGSIRGIQVAGEWEFWTMQDAPMSAPHPNEPSETTVGKGRETITSSGDGKDGRAGATNNAVLQLTDLARKMINDFVRVAALAGTTITENDLEIDVRPLPHMPPTNLPDGKMAVYIFLMGKQCLKVGKVGARSQARYTSQHYNPFSTASNLARSLLKESDKDDFADIDEGNVNEWIKNNTDRINILIDRSWGPKLLALLETFVQCRMNPQFEGYKNQEFEK